MMACISCLCLSGTGGCTFADFRIVYRDYFGSCSVTHFRAVCGQPFLGSRGLVPGSTAPLAMESEVSKHVRHIDKPTSDIGPCLSGALSWRRHAAKHYQAAKNQTDSHYKTL